MIIWLNGPFGIGKTTLAEALHKALPRSFIFDPEELGTCLRLLTPPEVCPADFQDDPRWRRGVPELLMDAVRALSGPVIVPMTLVVPDYAREILLPLQAQTTLRHIVLQAHPETITQRLVGRGNPLGSWPHQQMERCIQDLAQLPIDILVTLRLSTDDVSPAELVTQITAEWVN